MRAFMSKKLEKIINSPHGTDALRKVILGLSSQQQNSNNTKTIDIGKKKYKIQFVGRKPESVEE